MDASDPTHDGDVAAFAATTFDRLLGAFETISLYLGDRLGLFALLTEQGPLSSDEFAERAGIHSRYAREWLEQQAVAGVLVWTEGRFSLPAAHAAVLADPTSLSYLAPLARLAVAAASRTPELLRVYRDGGGVGWAEFGPDARDAQGDANRPWFERELATALAGVPTVNAVLSRPDARIVDIGCGHGWSTVALARAYPRAVVVGVDIDVPSLEAARAHAARTARVSFREADDGYGDDGSVDAGFVFEALHDMPRPVEVLSALRRALRDDGIVIVMDEAVAPEFAPPGDEIERVMYAYSTLICLPDSMSTPGSAATGTVMRPSVLASYARDAGYSAVEVLPIEGFSAFRFYLLTP